MENQPNKQLIINTQDALDPNFATHPTALFNPDGTPVVLLTTNDLPEATTDALALDNYDIDDATLAEPENGDTLNIVVGKLQKQLDLLMSTIATQTTTNLDFETRISALEGP